MTTVSLFMPPKSDEAVKQGVVKLLEAARDVGLNLEPQGFAMAWLSDHTRVVLASTDGKVTGLGILVFGRRYYDEEISATVLVAAGEARAEVLKFMLDSAKVLGAVEFFYEEAPGDTIGGEATPLRRLRVN